DLETDESERLLLRIREHAVGRRVERAQRLLVDEEVEEHDLGVRRRDRGREVARRRSLRQREALDGESAPEDAIADGLRVGATAAAHDETWPHAGVAHRGDRVDGPEPALVDVESRDLHERGSVTERR